MIKIYNIVEPNMRTYGFGLFKLFKIYMNISTLVGAHINLEIAIWRMSTQIGIGYYKKNI
jgi:hypothetical protein